MSIHQIKACLRRNILSQRRHLSPALRAHASQQICAQIQALPSYQHAHDIAFYFAVNGEIDLSALWHPLPQDKVCYFPVIYSSRLAFLPYTTATLLSNNQWGIPEPNLPIDDAIETQYLQIIFLPLVAFDIHGTRLGMGGGYYDRTLIDNQHTLRIGVAYEFQKQAYIPAASWDKPLHAVITETSTYWFSPPDLL